MIKDNKVVIENVHCYQIHDDYVMLDVPSGSVFNCDKITFDAYNALKEANGDFTKARELAKGNSEVAEALEEIYELADNEILFTDEVTSYNPPKTQIKSLCLNISHDCDLRCAYCFASTGHFGGERLNMPIEVAKGAIDFLMENSGNRHFLEVDFFGGEPLMNFEVVKETVAYSRIQEKKYNKEIAFTLTTNGVALTEEVTKWALDNNIAMVLSHDGLEEHHDSTRRFADGTGSYEIVTEHITEHLKSGIDNYYVRGTYTGENLNFVDDIQHWLDLGWRKMSMEPVVVKSGKRAIKMEDMDKIQKEYVRLADLYLEYKAKGDPFEFFHFNLDLDHAPCLPKRLTGCGAGYEYFVVTPNGDMYPCHQFVGRDGYKIGNLKDGITNPELSEEFRGTHVFTKEKCRHCWVRYYCSGGCHANAQLFHNDLKQPYEVGCELAKIRTEISLWLAMKKREEKNNELEQA